MSAWARATQAVNNKMESSALSATGVKGKTYQLTPQILSLRKGSLYAAPEASTASPNSCSRKYT